MRIVKYTHSCVRLETDGGVLVIDPGVWSEPHALEGADAVLVTHEHVDHIDAPRLLGMDVPVHAPDAPHSPDQPIETLFVPTQASWLKTDEAIRFVRAIRPQRALGIHEGQLNQRGLSSITGWLAQESGVDYRWLQPGEAA